MPNSLLLPKLLQFFISSIHKGFRFGFLQHHSGARKQVLMTTIATMLSSSLSGPPFYSSFSNPTPSFTFKTITVKRPRPRARTSTSFTWLNPQPRGILVEATPPSSPPSPSPRDGSIKVLALPENRADDIQAETRALARAANASVYSPQLVASKYGSQPMKVFNFFSFLLLPKFESFWDYLLWVWFGFVN